jgi:hypothetical protein
VGRYLLVAASLATAASLPLQGCDADTPSPAAVSPPAERARVETVAQAAADLSQLLESSDALPSPAHVEALARDAGVLRDKTIMIFGERRRRWEAANARLEEALGELARAVRDTDERKARGSLATLREAWRAMRAEYPAEALEVLPPLWTCSMHPAVMQAAAEACPICGMGLDPIYETQPQLSREPLIRAEIVADQPLRVGEPADLRIRLTFIKDEKPVTLDDLEETHTRKIHLLIIDLSETDYHHEHPEPVADGEYAFRITPSQPGPYRVWADLKPVLTRVQQYAIADITAENPLGRVAGEEPENRDAEIDGYRFHLEFEKPVIQTGDTVRGSLRVTGPDGQPYRRLQVVMGTFGHLVGFLDYSTVLHIHPVGRAIEPPDALGGPALDFYFRSASPGLIRLFTQVRIDDRQLFPRFVVRVEPRPQLAAR